MRHCPEAPLRKTLPRESPANAEGIPIRHEGANCADSTQALIFNIGGCAPLRRAGHLAVLALGFSGQKNPQGVDA